MHRILQSSTYSLKVRCTEVSNRMLLVDTAHDIIKIFCEYIFCPIATTLNPPPLTMYTKPVIIKPYTFPDPSCQARPPIPGIDPQLCPPPPDRTHRTKFSAEDLERLVRLAVDEEPWAKPRGQVTKSWNTILMKLQSEGRFRTSSITTIQNKLNGLLAWQEVFQIFEDIGYH